MGMTTHEINAEVAKLVMGFGDRVYLKNGVGYIRDMYSRVVPQYSDHIQHAFEVANQMRDKGYEFMLFSDWCGSGKWAAKFVERGGKCYYWESFSPSEAICMAALEAIKSA